MNTEAGEIQGNLHTWGIEEVQDYKVPWGNYAVEDTDGLIPIVGTDVYDVYNGYTAKLIKEYPDQLPTRLDQIPLPVVEEIEADPKLASFTYQCQRCYVGIRGREKRGDYCSMDCSACHIPYGNE